MTGILVGLAITAVTGAVALLVIGSADWDKSEQCLQRDREKKKGRT